MLNEKIKSPSIVAIIGGGYMAESFIKNINTDKLKQIIWINRSVDKIKKISKDLKINSKNIIEFCNLENAEQKIINADFIFAATQAGSHGKLCCLIYRKLHCG